MAGFNTGGPGLGNMPMQNNGPNGAAGRMVDDHPVDDANHEKKLNTFIYMYFMTKGKYDAARALKESGMEFDPPLQHSDGGVNGADDTMQTDSKDGIDMARPADLPEVKSLQNDGQGGSFLLSWFALFWDVYFAQRKNSGPRPTPNAAMYVQHTQNQVRIRQNQQDMLRTMPMGPNGVGMDYNNMIRFGMNGGENLARRAQMNRGAAGPQPTPQQLAQMQSQQRLMQHNQQMRRDPSEMDMNGQRPRTPSNGDHAPSPSKRMRMEPVPFNGQAMMPNGRGAPPGMTGQMVGGDAASNAQSLLVNHGINPGNLSESQFQSFQQQHPVVQQKSIQVYAQNLRKNQRQQSMSIAGGDITDQGSPIVPPGMDLGGIGAEFYNGANPTAMQMRGGAPPQGPNGGGGNHALQDYQMQLMLLEQQNKKRLLMARQEQDTIGGGRPDGMPGGMPGQGFPPGMSPGSRGGPSPGPDRKGGTPKMNQVGLPGSPMPDSTMRSSPAAMNFNGMNGMNPELYHQMNGNNMRPPSSHPGFPNGQYPPQQQQMEAMARAQQAQGRMPNGNGWQQGPQGPAPMIQQPQPQQPPPMGTPQQRNEMPPPQAVPNATANGRPTSPTAPPTPQPGTKANPKTTKTKEPRDRKKPVKKGSTNNPSVAPTPNSEADNAPPTPTPPTPVTSQHPKSFANTEQAQSNMMQGMTATAPEPLAPQQPDPNAMPFLETDYTDNMDFNNQLANPDILENFDFEQFLQSTDGGDFNFDPAAFEGEGGIEAGIGGGT